MTLGDYGPGPVSTRHNRKETPPDHPGDLKKLVATTAGSKVVDYSRRTPPAGKVMDYTRRPPPGRLKWDDNSSSDGSSTGAKRGGKMAKLYPNIEKMLNDSNGELPLMNPKELSMDRSNRSGSTCAETQMFSDSCTSFQVTLLDGSASNKGSAQVRYGDMDQSRSSRKSRHQHQRSPKKNSRFLSDTSVTSMQSDLRSSRDRPPKPSLREATPPRRPHPREVSPPPRLLDMRGRDVSPPRGSSRRNLYHRREPSPGRGRRGDCHRWNDRGSGRRDFDDRSVRGYDDRSHRGYEDRSVREYEEHGRGRGYYHPGEYDDEDRSRYYPEEDDERSRRSYHARGGRREHQGYYRDEYPPRAEGGRDLRDYYERSGSYRRGGEVYERRGYEPRYYEDGGGYQDEGRLRDSRRYDARYGREDPSFDARYHDRQHHGRDHLYADDRYEPRYDDHGYRNPRHEQRYNDRGMERRRHEESPRHGRFDERSHSGGRQDYGRFEEDKSYDSTSRRRVEDEDYNPADPEPESEPQPQPRGRRGETDLCMEKKRLLDQEQHHVRPGAFCEKGTGKGKLKDDSLYGDSISSRPGAFQQKRKGQLKDDKASSHTTTVGSDDPIYIEVFPGVTERLRRTKETKDAIAKDFYAPATCFACNMDVFCIADVKYYICPDCKCVNPLTDDIGKVGPPRTDVGIAFGYETLYKMQSELVHT